MVEVKEVVETPEVIAEEAPAETAGNALAEQQPVEAKPKQSPSFSWQAIKDLFTKELSIIPLAIIATLLIFHQLLVVWVGVVVFWSLCEAIYPRLPLALRLRIQKEIPEKWKTSAALHELIEGIGQVRPFVIASLYMFLAPFAIAWMAVHWGRSFFAKEDDDTDKVPAANPELITFRQNVRKVKEEEESNFFHSPAFGLTTLALFGCGLPAAFTLLLYQKLGMDALFGFPSHDPHFQTTFITIGLYMYSVGCAICLLFFRTWMTFPLHFAGNESTVELTPKMVQRKMHSWLTQTATINLPWGGRISMPWEEVKYLGYTAPHLVKMYPLPVGVFSPQSSPMYRFANKIAQLYDGIIARLPANETVYFSSSDARAAMSSKFPINLSDLDADQRASLFYAVRKWAPHVEIDPRVQDMVVGTSVMQAPRYTQMWFELLTDKMPRRRLGALASGDKLQDGKIVVSSRLSSGGQANVYLADKDGEEVVLKEFILSHADAVGALVESAGEFETESTLLSELKHDRIVKMKQFFAEDRRLYIVLERVRGVSLREHVKANGPLSVEKTVDVAKKVAEVLEYLHGQTPPVVHRDIAPDNIMLCDDGDIKLIDFSLAAAKKSRRTTSTMGKHSYAPPEQLREEPCPQSDLYGLGATMYFLLVGSDPKPITQSDVSSKRDDVPAKLNDVIKHATELDVENRYSEAKWLRLDLEQI